MDYKEKYEQALNRAKVINPGTADYEVAVKIFPELTENENEKMCEALIQYIKEPSVLLDWRRKEFITWLEKQSRNTSDKIVEKARTEKQRVLLTETDGSANIDWDCRSLDDVKALLNCGLEYIRTIEANKQILSANRFGGCSITLPSRHDKSIKQGEKKNAAKVEPKFKVGDWITFYGGTSFKILKIEAEDNGILDYLLLGQNGRDSFFNKKYVDENARLWTIQDAKDGDVLANENMVLIFKCFEEPSYRQHIIAHIGLDTCGYIQITNDSWNLGLNGANPATNEQRDLLFQKMKEAGYEWDAEKKELKKIEKKSAAYFYCKYGSVMPLCSDCKRNHLNSKYKTEEIETWMVPALRCTKQCFSYIQQKPAWNEEDEEIIKCLNNCLDELEEENGWRYVYVNYKNVELNKIRNWLKSLKQRMKGE